MFEILPLDHTISYYVASWLNYNSYICIEFCSFYKFVNVNDIFSLVYLTLYNHWWWQNCIMIVVLSCILNSNQCLKRKSLHIAIVMAAIFIVYKEHVGHYSNYIIPCPPCDSTSKLSCAVCTKSHSYLLNNNVNV